MFNFSLCTKQIATQLLSYMFFKYYKHPLKEEEISYLIFIDYFLTIIKVYELMKVTNHFSIHIFFPVWHPAILICSK